MKTKNLQRRAVLFVSKKMRAIDKAIAVEGLVEQDLSIVLLHGIDEEGHCTCSDGADCEKTGKHPVGSEFPKGYKSATKDISKLKRILKKNTNFNVAVVMPVNMIVIDIDNEAGQRWFDSQCFTKTVYSKTGRGRHYWFKVIGDAPEKFENIDGVDFKTHKGYCIVAPSTHHTGARYKWVGRNIGTINSNQLPVKKTTKRRRAVSTRSKPIKIGSRNNQLFSLARVFRTYFKGKSAALRLLRFVNENLTQKPLPNSELDALFESAGNYVIATDDLFVRVKEDDVPLSMEWLWYPYLPLYCLSMLVGNAGVGKSLISSLITAIVTSGGKWPGSDEECDEGIVMILSAENPWERSELGRLIAAGAKQTNLVRMTTFRALTPDTLHQLEEAIKKHKPKLVIIDTISAYMGGARDMNRQNEVGEFLHSLNEIAEKHACAILAIAHMNKQTGENPLNRIVGSIGFLASNRSTLFLGRDPDNPDNIALAHGKSNVAELGGTLLFEKQGGGRFGVPRLHFVGTSDATEVEICHIEKGDVGRPRDESERATKYVLDFLAEQDEPVKWSLVEEAAKRRAIASKSTLGIVRTELSRIGSIIQVGRGPATKWKISDQSTN